MSTCSECGMPVDPGDYHPYAACLMFKQCHDSDVVFENLDAVAAHGLLTAVHVAEPVAYVMGWHACEGGTFSYPYVQLDVKYFADEPRFKIGDKLYAHPPVAKLQADVRAFVESMTLPPMPKGPQQYWDAAQWHKWGDDYARASAVQAIAQWEASKK